MVDVNTLAFPKPDRANISPGWESGKSTCSTQKSQMDLTSRAHMSSGEETELGYLGGDLKDLKRQKVNYISDQSNGVLISHGVPYFSSPATTQQTEACTKLKSIKISQFFLGRRV